jgi:phosphoglycolate phosphatase
MAFDPSRVRAVLFDVDGTIRDTDDEVVHKVGGVLRRIGAGERADRLARSAVMALESPVQVILALADRVHLDGPINHALDYLAPHGPTELVPGAGEVIRALAGRYRMGIVSAGPRRAVERFVAEHELGGLMEVVITGQSYRRTKPHPEPVAGAARALGVDPSAAVMVGDTSVDVKAGRAAGAQTVGVLTGFGRRRDLERAGADLILDSVESLPAHLTG